MHRRAHDRIDFTSILDTESQQNQKGLRIIKGRQLPPDDSITTELLVRYYPEWIIEAEYQRCSARTIESKRNTIDKFLWWLSFTGHEIVTKYNIKSFIAYLHNAHETDAGRWESGRHEPLSARTIEIYFINLRAYLRWLAREGVIAFNPAETVTVPKSHAPQITPFTRDQVNALLHACKKTDFPYRNIAIISLLIDTGIRVNELCDLKFSDLTINTGTHGMLEIRHGKGDKRRIVPFDRSASRILRQYIRTLIITPDMYLFVGKGGGRRPVGSKLTPSGVQSLFERLEAISGISGVRCSPHTCRHTFAINFLRNNGSMAALQLILGHEKLEQVLTYAKLAESDIIQQHRQGSPLNSILE